MDADKTIAVSFEHTRTLDDRQYAFVQAALLYTTVTGDRRVRIFNVALRVVTLAGNVFQYADMDATVSYMLREGMYSLQGMTRECIDSRVGSNIEYVFAEDLSHPRHADGKMCSYPLCLSEVLCGICRAYPSMFLTIVVCLCDTGLTASSSFSQKHSARSHYMS